MSMCNGTCPCANGAGDDSRDPHLSIGDDGVGRREFVTRTFLAAVTSMLASGGIVSAVGCGNGIIGGEGLTAPSSLGGGASIQLSNFPTLANVGGIASVGVINGIPIAVTRTGTSTFVALSMVCTHQGTILSIAGSGFHCPNHGATFASDGQWTGGQPTSSLISYPVTYDATSGTLQIGGGSAGTVATIALQPTTATLVPPQSTQLTATLRDNTGTVVAGRVVTWSSSNTAVATVDATGLVTGVAAGGPVTITATCDSATATASVTVTSGQLAGGLVVDPALFPALATIGGIARVDNQLAGSLPIAVVRTSSTTWAAFSMVCPHQGTTINIVSGGFRCPNHGAQFNSAGANTGGQVTSALTSLPVTVQSDGTLLLQGTTTVPPGGGSGGDDGNDD